MKNEEYICDDCGLVIDGTISPERGGVRMAGGGELCILSYQGLVGHNKFIGDKHYHYSCFCNVVNRINDN